MSENQLLFYTVPDKSLENFLKGERMDQDVKYAIENMAVDVIKRDEWGPYLEGYSGILDDHDLDLNELGSNEAAETLTGLEDQSALVWFVFPAREAKKVAKKLRGVEISEEDAENYFETQDDTLSDLREVHATFLKALEEVEDGQTLVMPIAG